MHKLRSVMALVDNDGNVAGFRVDGGDVSVAQVMGGVSGGGAGVVSAPASASIALQAGADLYLDPLTISGATTITVSGGSKGSKAHMVVLPNGTNIPTVTGATEWSSTMGYLNTSLVPQMLDVEHNGHSIIFGWSRAMVPVADSAPPAPAVIPSAPTSFAAGAVSTTTQTLSWAAPATGSPTSYTYNIARRVNGSGAFPAPQQTGVSGLSVTVSGLTAATSYDYQITATNTAGTGPAATLTALVTSASLTVPGSVIGLVSGTPTTTSVALAWTMPSAGGGALTDYIVQYAPAGTSFAAPTVFPDGTTPVTGAVVSGLTASTGYDFRVAAVNAAGQGPWVSLTNITTASSGGSSSGTAVVFSLTDRLTNLGGEIYESQNSAATSWSAKGVVTGSAAGDCLFECQFPAATTTSTIFGMDAVDAGLRAYETNDYLCVIAGTGNISVAQNSTTFGSSLVTLTPGATVRAGIRRVGTTVTLETTTDDWATATVRHTFPGSSTGPLYAQAYTQYATANRRICQPRQTGFA